MTYMLPEIILHACDSENLNPPPFYRRPERQAIRSEAPGTQHVSVRRQFPSFWLLAFPFWSLLVEPAAPAFA